MSLALAKKLGLGNWKTSIVTQKIDSSLFNTYGIVIVTFLIKK